jgi:GxxExxY protein
MEKPPVEILFKDLSYKIIGLAMEVHTTLGPGFLEKVYRNSLMLLLQKNGIPAVQEYPLKVTFQGEVVGEYFADIVVP